MQKSIIAGLRQWEGIIVWCVILVSVSKIWTLVEGPVKTVEQSNTRLGWSVLLLGLYAIVRIPMLVREHVKAQRNELEQRGD